MRTRALGTGTFTGGGRGNTMSMNAYASVAGSSMTWRKWWTFDSATVKYSAAFGNGYLMPRRRGV